MISLNYWLNARKKNVSHFLCVNVRADEFETMNKLTEPFNDVYLSCGVHPLYLEEAFDFDVLSKHAEDSQSLLLVKQGLIITTQRILNPNNKNLLKNISNSLTN